MVIDVHAHIGHLRDHPDYLLDADDLVRKMDAWGIDRSIVLALGENAIPYYRDNDTETVLAACARHPERLTPFCLVALPADPGAPAVDHRPLLEAYRRRGCRGVGEFLPDVPFADPRCLAVYRQAGELGLPVLFDLHDVPGEYGMRDEPGLPGLERALRECPATVFIGHGPTFWAEVSANVTAAERRGYPYPTGPVIPGGAVPRLMARYPNLWADTSAGSGYYALSRDQAFGLDFARTYQDRLLFGTDSCRRSTADLVSPNREWLRQCRDQGLLAPAVCTKIESANAIRLLGL